MANLSQKSSAYDHGKGVLAGVAMNPRQVVAMAVGVAVGFEVGVRLGVSVLIRVGAVVGIWLGAGSVTGKKPSGVGWALAACGSHAVSTVSAIRKRTTQKTLEENRAFRVKL